MARGIYDEHDAFLCACKSEPYTEDEWAQEVVNLRAMLEDAEERHERAKVAGVCMPARFER